MKHLFLDTDVIIDFLGERKPFAKFALEMFLMGNNKQLKLYTSGNSVTTAYYILCKYTEEQNARNLILNLFDHINIIPVDLRILRLAFSSDFKDVEDAVQHFSALTISEISCIVTRNTKDYRNSKLEILTPEEAVRIYRK